MLRAHSDEAHRQARRGFEHGAVPGLGKVELFHRCLVHFRWWSHGHLVHGSPQFFIVCRPAADAMILMGSAVGLVFDHAVAVRASPIHAPLLPRACLELSRTCEGLAATPLLADTAVFVAARVPVVFGIHSERVWPVPGRKVLAIREPGSSVTVALLPSIRKRHEVVDVGFASAAIFELHGGCGERVCKSAGHSVALSRHRPVRQPQIQHVLACVGPLQSASTCSLATTGWFYRGRRRGLWGCFRGEGRSGGWFRTNESRRFNASGQQAGDQQAGRRWRTTKTAVSKGHSLARDSSADLLKHQLPETPVYNPLR